MNDGTVHDDPVTAALVAFLRARLEEDERAARAATGGPWTADPVTGVVRGADAAVVAEVRVSAADALHLARHDPRRALLRAYALRQVVDAAATGCGPACRAEHAFDRGCALHRLGPVHEQDGARWLIDDTGARHEPPPVVTAWTLRLLALPYAHHPDHRPEWAPGR
ncbi:DUF6221 family protein [Kitasatospora sp. NPDC088391]|uniref:DUF6221 family protein n=1 Tax=Kitasatospora sp. NPDC088391 TaxID=3364074 RepID=UPI0038092474